MTVTVPTSPFFIQCALDPAHVDVRFACGHQVHTDMPFGAAVANIPEHKCGSSDT